MKRSWPQRIHVPTDPLPSDEPTDALNALERAARIADLKDRMAICLEELDRLQIVYSANYLSHALALLDDEA